MNSRLARLAFAIAGSALLVSSAQAQGHVSFTSPIRATAPLRGGSGASRTRVVLRGARRSYARPSYYPYFYPNYYSEAEMVEAPPAEIFEESPAPSPAAPARVPGAALMIELQGDHWVRVTNNGETQVSGDSSQQTAQHEGNLSSAAPPPLRRAEASEPPMELPHAVLVFRDGHQEEITKYMISGATIYAGADYWSGGSWTRKVQIAELDVPATLKLNQGRGAKFTLPSGPDEVMIRP